MNYLFKALATTALVVGASQAASAATVIVPISGAIGSTGTFTATLNLDVVNGQALSGTGTINLLSYVNAPVSLITTYTPGNNNTSASAPVGFRANNGTDYFGLDTAYPFSTNGLLFAVDTTTPTPGGSPLLALYSNGDGTFGAQFTGFVNGVEYYNQSGSFSVAAVPEPATWAMMLVGFGIMGAAMRYRRRNTAVSFA